MRLQDHGDPTQDPRRNRVDTAAVRNSDLHRSDPAESPSHRLSAPGSPRVLLAHHHLVFLKGLHTFLEGRGLRIVGRATNGTDAVRLTREQRPDVAVLDLMMPALNGVDAAWQIAAVNPGIGIILLSELTGEQVVRDALRAGVRGFVVKTQRAEILVHAIHEVWRGGMYVSAGPARAVMEACLAGVRKLDALSPRQREVLRLVAEGNTAKEAAALLRISVRTVDAHRASIMRALGIHDTPGLVRYAIRQGLITA